MGYVEIGGVRVSVWEACFNVLELFGSVCEVTFALATRPGMFPPVSLSPEISISNRMTASTDSVRSGQSRRNNGALFYPYQFFGGFY